MFGQGASATVGQPTPWHTNRHRLTILIAGPPDACAGGHPARHANAARQPWPNRVTLTVSYAGSALQQGWAVRVVLSGA